jgi:hypothetical protein
MKIYVYVNIFLCFSTVFAQQPADSDVQIEFGKPNLSIDQPFILSVVIKNNSNRPSVLFPDFQGLEKRSASATSTTSTISGKTVLIQTISQQYFAQQEGTFELPAFTVSVDGSKVKSEGITLTFGKNEKASESTTQPLKDLEMGTANAEVGAEEVFLSTRVSKSSVYVREGFALRLSLYVAKSATISMDFYQLDIQLQAILKKLRPATCWEENVGIEEIIQRQVTINGRQYTEYQMYQAMFFPFTLQTVTFPSVGLDMLLVNSEEKKGNNKRLQTFRSSPLRVQVKPLPAHPLKDQIAVGQYHLQEQITSRKVSAGESLRYLFTIAGKGNLATITAPALPDSKAFDFYPPDVKQTVRRSYEEVSGEKTYDYYIVAKQKGQFPLGRFFQWIYFDPQRARYDTLRSSLAVGVVGENLQTTMLANEGTASLYDNIEALNTNTTYTDYQDIIRRLTNMVVLALLGVMIWIFRK